MTPEDWIGRPIADTQGRPYGTLDELFVGRQSGEPEYGIVSVGHPGGRGTKRVAVPLAGGRVEGDVVVLPLEPDRVRDAPEVQRSVESIPPAAGARIEAFFAGSGEPTTPMPATTADGVEAVVETDDAAEVTVSEEELVVDKQARVTERVRLRKRIVEEEVTVSVTLRREELVVERVPVDDPAAEPERGGGDQQLTEGVLEFVLLAEEPVVEKRVVPVERVRVERDTIVEQRRITDHVRKERAEAESDPSREEHHPA